MSLTLRFRCESLREREKEERVEVTMDELHDVLGHLFLMFFSRDELIVEHDGAHGGLEFTLVLLSETKTIGEFFGQARVLLSFVAVDEREACFEGKTEIGVNLHHAKTRFE